MIGRHASYHYTTQPVNVQQTPYRQQRVGGWELFVESAGGVRGACSLLLFECRCAVVGAPASPASTPQAKGCPSTPRRKGASGSAVSPTANCYLPRGDPFGNQVGMPVLQKTYLGMLQPTTHVCPKSGDSGRSIPGDLWQCTGMQRQS